MYCSATSTSRTFVKHWELPELPTVFRRRQWSHVSLALPKWKTWRISRASHLESLVAKTETLDEAPSDGMHTSQEEVPQTNVAAGAATIIAVPCGASVSETCPDKINETGKQADLDIT